jgi:5-methylcytosine-specific restriction endonuclease McrA
VGKEFCLRPEQRVAIRERDDNECQGCGLFQPCTRDVPLRIHLQVHHIIPRAYSVRLGLNPNYGENLVTLCENMHIGHPTLSIHPDTYQARETYRGEKNSYNQMVVSRLEKMANREIYWNNMYDRQLTVIAARNTQEKEEEGWVFPK